MEGLYLMRLSKMENSDFEKICSHLEYLGYKIEFSEGFYIAKHQNKENLGLEKTYFGTRFLTFWVPRPDIEKHLEEYRIYINSLNVVTILGSYHIQDNLNLYHRLFFFCPYEKQVFTTFMEMMDHDFANLYDKDIGDASKYLA